MTLVHFITLNGVLMVAQIWILLRAESFYFIQKFPPLLCLFVGFWMFEKQLKCVNFQHIFVRSFIYHHCVQINKQKSETGKLKNSLNKLSH